MTTRPEESLRDVVAEEVALGNLDGSGLALLRLDADRNAVDESGCTPLYEAALGVYLNESAAWNYVEAARMLLEAGADPNLQDSRNYFTPLQAASYSFCLPMVQLLLKEGAAVDIRTNKGETPLHPTCRFA